jgi:hypothetical protein
MDKLGNRVPNSTGGLTGDLVDFIILSGLLQPESGDGKGGSVYREDRYECYRVGTELHMGGRHKEEAPQEEEIPMEKLLWSYSPYQLLF